MKLSIQSVFVISALFFIVLGSTVVGNSQERQKPLKVGFIMAGPLSDQGWNYAHDQGRLFLESQLRGQVQTTVAENIPESAEVERIMEKMIAQGNKLIFATAYGYLEPALRVAAHHPDVIIMHCGNRSRPQSANNVGTYFASQYEAAYVVGVVAGRATKTNEIGCVSGHPVPQIIEKLDAFAMGVRSVNPCAKIRVIWTNSWSDPPTEVEAAESLIDKRADVLSSGDLDCPLSVLHIAAKHRIYTASYNCADLHTLAPESWLVSAYWNWGPLYVKIAKSVIDHNWKASDDRYAFKDGYIKLSSFGKAVPKTVQIEVGDLLKRIAAGQFVVFKGPIEDRDGHVRIPAGQLAEKGCLEKIDWFVPGIEGSIPKK